MRVRGGYRERPKKKHGEARRKFNDREELVGWRVLVHTSLACVIGRGLMMCRISSFHRPFLTSRPGLSAFSRQTRSLFGALSALSHLRSTDTKEETATSPDSRHLDDADKNKSMEHNVDADNEPTKEVGLAIHVEHNSDTPDGLTVACVRVRKVNSIDD